MEGKGPRCIVHIVLYIYIYTHMHTSYIYIYIYMHMYMWNINTYMVAQDVHAHVMCESIQIHRT